jgi:hypothetical protein
VSFLAVHYGEEVLVGKCFTTCLFLFTFLKDDKAGFLKLGGSFVVGYMANAILLLPIFEPGPASWNHINNFWYLFPLFPGILLVLIRSWFLHIARHDVPVFGIPTDYGYSSPFANLYHFYSTTAGQVMYVGIVFLFLGIAASISSVIVRYDYHESQ